MLKAPLKYRSKFVKNNLKTPLTVNWNLPQNPAKQNPKVKHTLMKYLVLINFSLC